MRNLVILSAIILTYLLPTNDNTESMWFAFQTIPSTFLIAFLFIWQYLRPNKLTEFVILLEISATFITLTACLQYALSLKTASIYSQYENIMTAIFIIELAVVMGVILRDVGITAKHNIRYFCYNHFNQSIISNICFSETALCKIL